MLVIRKRIDFGILTPPPKLTKPQSWKMVADLAIASGCRQLKLTIKILSPRLGARMHFAHSTENPDRSDWQVLADHLKAVAELALAPGEKFGAGSAAALAGRLHDLGKYTEAFQRRLAGSPERVDHATAGARIALGLAKQGTQPDRLMADVVAYAVAGHHAGLPDRQIGAASLDDRVTNKDIPPLDPTWATEVSLATAGLFPVHFRWHAEAKRRRTAASCSNDESVTIRDRIKTKRALHIA
jgi:CRISPR-associated endonuclease Cas3-HD